MKLKESCISLTLPHPPEPCLFQYADDCQTTEQLAQDGRQPLRTDAGCKQAGMRGVAAACGLGAMLLSNVKTTSLEIVVLFLACLISAHKAVSGIALASLYMVQTGTGTHL